MSRNQDRQDVGLLMPRQEGVVLLVMLALLFIATLLGIAMVVSTTGETRMASLRSQREFSHTLAEAGASAVALKALNDLDPNQALQNQPWDCTTLGWQGGMGSTTSQTQPGGACTIALEAQGGSYSGWLKISAGSSDTMANQLRAQAAVVPLLSGIGPIIGAPGRAGFVVAAATLSPDPGAAAIPGAAAQSPWLQRNGGWYWPVASATGNQSTPQSQSEGATTTQPFALDAIPKPGSLPDQPWTTYQWQDYKRGLGSDAVTALRKIAVEEEGGLTEGDKKNDVASRYEKLKQAYEDWVKAGSDYNTAAMTAVAVATALDLGVTVTVELLVTLVGTFIPGLETVIGTVLGPIEGVIADVTVGPFITEMETRGDAYIQAAADVITDRQAIRKPWVTLADLENAENGAEAIWKCGDDDTDRMKYNTEGLFGEVEVDLAALMVKTDAKFQTETADNLLAESAIANMEMMVENAISLMGVVPVVPIPTPTTVNRDKVDEAATALNETALGLVGDDPIGTEITNSELFSDDTAAEIEPRFMLVAGTAGGLVQTNPMCNPDAPLIIEAQGGAEGVQVKQVTVVHTGPITFKAEAPVDKVSTILVSNKDITVESATPDTADKAGILLWADGDVTIKRPVEGAVVAGNAVTVDTTNQLNDDDPMLTYNPALDPSLLGDPGRFPLAGYTLGSWTSLASAQ